MRRALEASDDCLSVAELAECLDHGLDYERLTAAEAHLAACPHCMAELSLLRVFKSGALRAEKAGDVRWIQARLKKQVSREQVPWWMQVLQPRWVSALSVAAAAALVVISAGVSLHSVGEPALRSWSARPDVLRSGRLNGLTPAGDLITAPTELRWGPVAAALGYEVKLMEVDGAEVWHAQSQDPRVVLPSEAAAKIVPGKALLWQVTAFNAAGEKIAVSERQRFRLRP